MTCLQVIVESKSKIKLKIKIVRSAAVKRASWSVCHACYLLSVVDSLFGTCLLTPSTFVTSYNAYRESWQCPILNAWSSLSLSTSASGGLRPTGRLIALVGCFHVCSITTQLNFLWFGISGLFIPPRRRRLSMRSYWQCNSAAVAGGARSYTWTVWVGRGSPTLLSALSTDQDGAGALLLLMIYDD